IELGGLGERLHTDIYLAGVWVAALEGVRELARRMGDDAVRRDADALLERATRSLEDRFWLDGAGTSAVALLAPPRATAEARGAPSRTGPGRRPPASSRRRCRPRRGTRRWGPRRPARRRRRRRATTMRSRSGARPRCRSA